MPQKVFKKVNSLSIETTTTILFFQPRHQGSWEGRNFEDTSTEIRWTGPVRGRQKQSNSK